MGNAHWSSRGCSACALIRVQVSLILETPCLLHFCVGQIIGTLHISLESFLGKLLIFRPSYFIVLESLLVSNLWLSASVKFSWVGHHAEFHGSSASKESTCNAGDPGSIPGSGRSPRGGHGTPVFLPGESPWTEEAGGLQSTRSQRGEPDWAAKHKIHL